MTDAKPYTAKEARDIYCHWSAEDISLDRFRATVEALEAVTRERDEARSVHAVMSEWMHKLETQRNDARYEAEMHKGLRAETLKANENLRAEVERLKGRIAEMEREPSPREVAERQREACVREVEALIERRWPDLGDRPSSPPAAVLDALTRVSATPLVTGGGE